jgi:serine/threonine-protein kinase
MKRRALGAEFAHATAMPHHLPIDSLPREGELFDGKYRIGAVLGVGGMAAVLAARHLGFDEMVAIKLLLPECVDDPAVVERFLQEGKTAVKIRSEHVVRMLDVGVCAGRAYLVMEHLDGRDLDLLLREGGSLPVGAAVDLLLQACEAIGEAHALGIIHRDLKPANLFLTHRVDGSPCVKVLDFGISKMPRRVSGVSFASSPPTLPAMIMGSPQYMSPEQMTSAASADERSDIWSLGAILYELLTARTAFGGMSTAEVCARVLQGAPVPIEHLEADVPNDVVLIVARCLEKDPARRYANVAEFARVLAPFGSRGARASAESIARVYEGREDAPPAPPGEGGTMKPTAKSILATLPKPRGRLSGYLGAALLALAAVAGVVGGVGRYVGALPVAARVAGSVPSSLSAPSVSSPVALPSASASAFVTVAPPAGPAEHHHADAGAPLASPIAHTVAGSEDGGPYYAP